MRGYIGSVHSHCELAAFQEVLGGDRGNGNVRGRVLHAFCVLVWSEDVDVASWVSESFQSFVALLAVVQTWSHAMYPEIGIFNELW